MPWLSKQAVHPAASVAPPTVLAPSVPVGTHPQGRPRPDVSVGTGRGVAML